MAAHEIAMKETNWPAVAEYVSKRNDTYPTINPAEADMVGRSVLVMGASKGIGKATAISFATAGCSKILLAARSDLADVETAIYDAATRANRPQPVVHFLKVDITSEDSVRNAAAKAAGVLDGSLDVLISNAGYLEKASLLVESEPSEWWKTWEVNVKGPYLAARFFIPLLLESQTKTVINVTSDGAHVMFAGMSAYQTTKFALCRLTEFMNREYYDQGLIAMALHPGAVKTELSRNVAAERQHCLTDTPQLAADTMVWLTSERREWLAGRLLGHGGVGA